MILVLLLLRQHISHTLRSLFAVQHLTIKWRVFNNIQPPPWFAPLEKGNLRRYRISTTGLSLILPIVNGFSSARRQSHDRLPAKNIWLSIWRHCPASPSLSSLDGTTLRRDLKKSNFHLNLNQNFDSYIQFQLKGSGHVYSRPRLASHWAYTNYMTNVNLSWTPKWRGQKTIEE